MALSDLLRALEEDAAIQRRAILEEARAEAKALAAAAAARGAELASARRSRMLADRRAAADERAASTRQSAARQLAAVRRETLDAVVATARKRLAGALAAHPELVDLLVERALEHLDRPAIARCPPSIAAAVAAAVERLAAPELDVALAAHPAAAAGVVLEARDGSLAIDATLEGMLDQARPEIEIDLVHRIEGGAS